MARVHAKKLIGLPVHTESGDQVGKVVDLVIDAESHQVVRYVVSASTPVQQLLGNNEDLLVAPQSVVSITQEQMVVHDLGDTNVVDLGEASVKKTRLAGGMAGISRSSQE